MLNKLRKILYGEKTKKNRNPKPITGLDKELKKSKIFLKQQSKHALNEHIDAHKAEIDDLKEKLKEYLLEKLDSLPKGKKMAITLVDIQNDFCLKDFALYVSGGEQTVISNIALLDAINELIKEDPSRAEQIDIITTQDTHRKNREPDTPGDIELQAYQAEYGDDVAARIAKEEAQELLPINPPENSFGEHCMVGTDGVAICEPIEERLQALKAVGVSVHRFGKIVFSSPRGSLRLSDDIDPSKPEALKQSIYDPSNQSILDHLSEQDYAIICATGICGDVCVQKFVEGVADSDYVNAGVEVLDSCVHYLVKNDVGKTYDATRNITEQAYRKREHQVSVISIDGHRSNEGEESDDFRQEATHHNMP